MKTVRAFVLGGVAAGVFALSAGAAHHEVTQCLAAAKKDDHAATVEVCTKAAKLDPENKAVQEALKNAKAAHAAAEGATPPAMGDN